MNLQFFCPSLPSARLMNICYYTSLHTIKLTLWHFLLNAHISSHAVLGIKPRAACLPDQYATTESYLQSLSIYSNRNNKNSEDTDPSCRSDLRNSEGIGTVCSASVSGLIHDWHQQNVIRSHWLPGDFPQHADVFKQR